MEKEITYYGAPAKVGCDEKCNKAWGINNRPRVYLDISETQIFGLEGTSIYPDTEDDINIDNYAYCADGELPDAPIDPETYENDDAKPTCKSEMGNRWCVRECERCQMSEYGKHNEPLKLKDFSQRFYNMYPHMREKS